MLKRLVFSSAAITGLTGPALALCAAAQTMPGGTPAASTQTAGSQGAGNQAAAATAADWTGVSGRFVLGTALAFMVATVAYAIAVQRAKSDKQGRNLELNIFTPLTGLKSGWSFKDSWATTATTGATLITGIFASSDLLKGVLGKDAGAPLTVMLVASAFATALVGAGVLITKAFAAEDQPLGIGVLVAGMVTLGGVMGQILVVADQAQKLALGDLADLATPLAISACVLVAIYGLVTLQSLLVSGSAKAKPASPSDALLAAALVSSPSATAAEIVARATHVRDEAAAPKSPAEIRAQIAPVVTDPDLTDALVEHLGSVPIVNVMEERAPEVRRSAVL